MALKLGTKVLKSYMTLVVNKSSISYQIEKLVLHLHLMMVKAT